MPYTVEKIGGTSMTAFDAVLDNIFLRPENPYNRVFVVSAYSGITDALLECKKTGNPGIYQMIAKRDQGWRDAFQVLEDRMLLINEHIFADPMNRICADKFIGERIAEAKSCIQKLFETSQYSQFSLEQYLPQIREFLSSLGEAHSAFNTVLKLQSIHINATFIDLSGWREADHGKLDEIILRAFDTIDVTQELPIVTGYAYCDEGLMKTYDRGYSEMTFSRIAALTNADSAIIHKEYHLSTADPKIVGPESVRPMGKTNFDVADQLANLGMEAIHPNAAAGLCEKKIPLRVKNTFEPEHEGTLISNDYQPECEKIEIIAGRNNVFALHIYVPMAEQTVVGLTEHTLTEHTLTDHALTDHTLTDHSLTETDRVSHELLMDMIAEEQVQLIGKEMMSTNTTTYYLNGSREHLDSLLDKVKRCYPNVSVAGEMVALVRAIGAQMNTNVALVEGMLALKNAGIMPMAAHTSLQNTNAQFCVEDQDYKNAIRQLHHVLIDKQAIPAIPANQVMKQATVA